MNTKLIIHIVISLISLSGLIVYYYAFLLGYKKHNSQLKKQSKIPEKLYFMSTYPALIWYVLPFIEQPRMHGIYDWLNGEFVFFNVLYIPVSFLLFVYFFGIWGKKSVSQNIEATKSAFYAPSKLLTEGIYARVQHPMIIGDILGHFSLVLLTGGIYTCILFPIYVFIDLFMIKIQVKYSLEPYYKSELIVYRKKTPVLLDQKLLFIVLFMA
ncbi:methyltransferase, partial [Bacteroides xylanisolvens]